MHRRALAALLATVLLGVGPSATPADAATTRAEIDALRAVALVESEGEPVRIVVAAAPDTTTPLPPGAKILGGIAFGARASSYLAMPQTAAAALAAYGRRLAAAGWRRDTRTFGGSAIARMRAELVTFCTADARLMVTAKAAPTDVRSSLVIVQREHASFAPTMPCTPTSRRIDPIPRLATIPDATFDDTATKGNVASGASATGAATIRWRHLRSARSLREVAASFTGALARAGWTAIDAPAPDGTQLSRTFRIPSESPAARGVLLVIRTEPSTYDAFIRALAAPSHAAAPRVEPGNLETAMPGAVHAFFTAAVGTRAGGVLLGSAPPTTASLLPSGTTVLGSRSHEGFDETWAVASNGAAETLASLTAIGRHAGFRPIPEFLAGGFRTENARPVGFCGDEAWFTDTLVTDPDEPRRTYVHILRATGTIAGNVCPGILETPGAIIPALPADATLRIDRAIFAFKPYDGAASIPAREQHGVSWAHIRYEGTREELMATIARRLVAAGWTAAARCTSGVRSASRRRTTAAACLPSCGRRRKPTTRSFACCRALCRLRELARDRGAEFRVVGRNGHRSRSREIRGRRGRARVRSRRATPGPRTAA